MLQWRQNGEAVEVVGTAIGTARAAALRAARTSGAAAGARAAHRTALHAPDAHAARFVSFLVLPDILTLTQNHANSIVLTEL